MSSFGKPAADKRGQRGKPGGNQNKYPRNQMLNIHKLPTIVTGVPEELFQKHQLRIVITGPRQIQLEMMETDALGQPKESIPITEAQKLAKAAGFVKAQAKESERSELTERARIFYFQNRRDLDIKNVKDPKAFAAKIYQYQESILKVQNLCNRAGDLDEDVAAKDFIKIMASRANQVIERMVTEAENPNAPSESELFMEFGFPASMKSKILGGALRVENQAKLWTSLIGKDPSKFCNLTIRELRGFTEEQLQVFFPEDCIVRGEHGDDLELGKLLKEKFSDLKERGTEKEKPGEPQKEAPTESNEFIQLLKALTTDDMLQESLATPWKDASERQKEQILKFALPTPVRVRSTELLKRMEQTKTSCSLLNEASSAFPRFTALANLLIKRFYFVAPRDMASIKKYWDKISGQELTDPSINSTNYRQQTIEILQKQNEREDIRAHLSETVQPVALPFGRPLDQAFLRNIRTTATGRAVYVAEGFDEFFPDVLFPEKKETKKKDRHRAALAVHSELTRDSTRWLKKMAKANVHPTIIASVQKYLTNFMSTEIQSMAAKIVFLTCQLDVGEAQYQILKTTESDMNPLVDDDSEEEEDDDDGIEPLKSGMDQPDAAALAGSKSLG